MANIRLDLDVGIYDGQNLTFKAPCDSTDVTGLIIYYPNSDTTESTVFTFKDAHGNALDALDLFAEGAYLTVVLDTVNQTCYFKNADTNAYLEGRFNGKSNIPTYTLHTLLSASWTEDGTYSLEADYPSERYDIEVSVSENATIEQLQAFGNAGIVGNSTTNIIKALGTVPEEDIEVIIKAVIK